MTTKIAEFPAQAAWPCGLDYSGDYWGDFATQAKATTYRAASYLTDPFCKTHEYFRRIQIVDVLNPEGDPICNFARKVILAVGIVIAAALALITSGPGALLRGLAANLESEPFIHFHTDQPEKTLPENHTFSLLSWNICCVGGGYAITNGGVVPWQDRIDRIVDKIIQADADVNCLYETFDLESAFVIYEKLREKGYSHFYFNMGARATGVTSGIMIASKYAVKNPEFTPYPVETLIGRVKQSSKGLFTCDLQSEDQTFATVISTHLMHSAQSDTPTAEEVECRRQQMEIVMQKVDRVKDRCTVVNGDLNLSDDEYARSSWQARFQKGVEFPDTQKTWGGDEFCAALIDDLSSGPVNLDHTMIVKDTARAIHTTLVETGFDGKVFKEEALSDHAGLLSQITVY
jgi:endonuclease/exonuclease/phosphatase family metal-dependent hydrolase